MSEDIRHEYRAAGFKEMSDDDWFERDRRFRRMTALLEDGEMFGLVPAEEAELAALLEEFGADAPETDQ